MDLCHLDSASNDKFSVEFWILIIVIFWPRSRFAFGGTFKITKSYLLSWGTREGAPKFKTQPRLKNITITNIPNLTLNLSFDTLLKWHDPDIRKRNWSWLCCVILPLQSIREAKHPDVYSFQDGAKSRTRYRERFALALGMNSVFGPDF